MTDRNPVCTLPEKSSLNVVQRLLTIVDRLVVTKAFTADLNLNAITSLLYRETASDTATFQLSLRLVVDFGYHSTVFSACSLLTMLLTPTQVCFHFVEPCSC